MEKAKEFQDKIETVLNEAENGDPISKEDANEWHNRIDIIIEQLRVFQDELPE